MRKNKLMIRKPSAMIQTSVKGMTLTQRKLINALVKVAQDMGQQEEYTLPISFTKKMCGISMMGNNDLKQQMLSLQDVKIIFNYLGKDGEIWESNVLLPRVRIEPNTGIIKFEFTSFVRQQILNPSMYAPLDLLTLACSKSTYTIILYEFLRDYLDSPKIPHLTIDQFRELMGVDDGEYKMFKDFRKRVIDVAHDEVNEKTDLSCRYELTKETGNKYTKIQWFAERKTPKPLDRSVLLEDRSSLPEKILAALPEKHRIEAVFDVLRSYCVEPFDEAFVISNIRYALGKAKKNFPLYLSKALKDDFARATREGESQERRIIDRTAEERRQAQEEQAAFDLEGNRRYEALHVSELERLEEEIKRKLRSEGIEDSYMLKGMIKARVILHLMGIDPTKDIKQESLF